MSFIIQFLAGRLGGWAAGILLVLVVGGIQQVRVWSLKSDLSAAQAEVADLNTRLGVERANVARLQTSITEQNAAVEKMRSDATASAAKRAEEALRVLRKPKTPAHPQTAKDMNEWLSGQ